MELKGEKRIAASREKVYEALNDPEVLKQSIPGCQSLTKKSDTEFEAAVGIKIGPVKANFKGEVELSDLNPPENYTISGEGKGGTAGHARGSAKVNLVEDGDGTILKYDVNAAVGGKLAQLGARLIDSTAKKLAQQFFTKFGEIVEGGNKIDSVPADTEIPAASSISSSSDQIIWWVIGAAIAILVGIYFF
jgi:hypothetical protein